MTQDLQPQRPAPILSTHTERALKAIPDHCRESARRYILRGTPLGSFLRAVFSNDLVGAARTADPSNLASLPQYAELLYWVPIPCWGSRTIVDGWTRIGGLTAWLNPDHVPDSVSDFRLRHQKEVERCVRERCS